jgi:hypothetical protein
MVSVTGKACYKCGGTATGAIVVCDAPTPTGIATALCRDCLQTVDDFLSSSSTLKDIVKDDDNVLEFDWRP